MRADPQRHAVGIGNRLIDVVTQRRGRRIGLHALARLNHRIARLAHRGAQALAIGSAPASRDQNPANRGRVELHQLRHGIVNEGLGLIGRSRNGEAVPVRNARAARKQESH